MLHTGIFQKYEMLQTLINERIKKCLAFENSTIEQSLSKSFNDSLMFSIA